MRVNRVRQIYKVCRFVLVALLLALPLLTGCRGDADAPDIPAEVDDKDIPKGSVTLDLSIGIDGDGNPGTRAFDEKQDGDFENPNPHHPNSDYENVHTLRVVIVRHINQADGSIRDVVEHNRMVNVNTDYVNNGLNLITSYYILHDNLRFNLIGGEKKTIYLFANEGYVSDKTGFNFTDRLKVGTSFDSNIIANLLIKREDNTPYIDNMTVTDENGVIRRKQYIPMSEAFDIDVPAPDGTGETFYHQTLFLTRSLIKFSFSVSLVDREGDEFMSPDDIENFGLKLVGVKIANLANSSYYLPKDTKYNPWKYSPENETTGNPWFDLGKTYDTLEDSYKRLITSFEMPQNPGVSDCTFKFTEALEITKKGMESYPLIYLPESKLAEGSNYDVSLIFDDETFNEIYGSQPLQIRDIPRNTHVKVNIFISLRRQTMSATVTLFPYTAVKLNPEFGFNVPVESVELSETEHTLEVGESFSLNGWVLPQNATDKNLIWKSNSPEVAEVTFYGLVEAKEVGTAIIRAIARDATGKYKDCTVTVTPKKETE